MFQDKVKKAAQAKKLLYNQLATNARIELIFYINWLFLAKHQLHVEDFYAPQERISLSISYSHNNFEASYLFVPKCTKLHPNGDTPMLLSTPYNFYLAAAIKMAVACK
ncbi:hypothetical protein [Parasediminibacterium sp. JCM 36343]|uniref:hypothetical protein n=1 Tax=Parasediminibacterium sp. JCM 36343 TaxID=3374279 RepID=UPI0039782230